MMSSTTDKIDASLELLREVYNFRTLDGHAILLKLIKLCLLLKKVHHSSSCEVKIK